MVERPAVNRKAIGSSPIISVSSSKQALGREIKTGIEKNERTI